MSAIFVDTSVLVKFYYPEKDSDRVENLILSSQLVYLSTLTIVEMASALSKKVRTKELKKGKEIAIWNSFQDDLETEQIQVVTLDERHYFKAADLVREFGGRYGIKTLDALHLSTAHGLQPVEFVCSDKSLSNVALKLGLNVRGV